MVKFAELLLYESCRARTRQLLFLISQLRDSSHRKTAPAVCSAPTLPALAPGARRGGADGGEDPPSCAGPSVVATGTGWSRGMDGLWDGLQEQFTVGSVTAG